MKNKHQIRPVTHKTDYAKPRYVSTPDGLYEFLGYNDLTLIARLPGTFVCRFFNPNDVVFYPDVGKLVFYHDISTDSYFSAEVLEVYPVDGVPRFKIRMRDVRWNNPISVFTVFEDDLSF